MKKKTMISAALAAAVAAAGLFYFRYADPLDKAAAMTEPTPAVPIVAGLVTRSAFAVADPPPQDLDARSKFAIRLENVDFEVSRLYEDSLLGSGARAADRIRTITFEADRMTIMLTVVEAGDGSLRVEGWLAPPASLRVGLRVADPGDSHGRTIDAHADVHGRFAFDSVAPGLSQFTVHSGLDSPALVTAPVRL